MLEERSLTGLLREAVVPYLQTAIATPLPQAILRNWLLTRARGWGGGHGPRVLLASIPGDEQDLPLICFGLALRTHGWRVTYLGPSLPMATIVETAELLGPAQIVVNVTAQERAMRHRSELVALATIAPLALVGGGASDELADAFGAECLDDDPVEAAASRRLRGCERTPVN